MKRSLLLAIALISGTPAQTASFTDCRSLHELCQDGLTHASSAQACKHYITGSIDQLLESGDKRACLGSKPSLSAIQDIVIKWLADHPQQRHLGASSCVIIAVSDAFPCGR